MAIEGPGNRIGCLAQHPREWADLDVRAVWARSELCLAGAGRQSQPPVHDPDELACSNFPWLAHQPIAAAAAFQASVVTQFNAGRFEKLVRKILRRCDLRKSGSVPWIHVALRDRRGRAAHIFPDSIASYFFKCSVHSIRLLRSWVIESMKVRQAWKPCRPGSRVWAGIAAAGSEAVLANHMDRACNGQELSYSKREIFLESAESCRKPPPLFQRISWRRKRPLRLILIIILILLLVGALPAWPYSAAWGYYPSGGLGFLLIVLLILALLGVI